MGRVRESCIIALRERADLCDVASAYVNLRRAGAYFRGLSPFNEEKTPSFFIHPERRWFHCYSSGHAGDVFHLVQLKEGMSFREAVEFLAEKYHFPLEYESGGGEEEEGLSKTTLLAIQNHAGRLFRENFFAPTAEGHTARRYWTEERHFSLEAAERYGIGLASANSRDFCQTLLKYFSEEALEAAGLCLRAERSPQTLLCRFRGRLTIPIRDIQNRIVAFSGRLIRETTDNAKYINSPETALFRKSSLLFGLCQARKEVTEENPFLLTEGPLDCLRCWECGLSTSIAIQGTAITNQHLALLRRHSPRLECLLDGDKAGERAALRLIPMALRAGLELRLLRLPPNQDPDLFLLEKGKEGLLALPQLGVAEFLVSAHLSEQVSRSIEQRREGLWQILQTVVTADSPALEQELLHQISLLAAIPLDVLHREYCSLERKSARNISTPRTSTVPFCVGDSLLALYARNPHWRQALAEQVLPEWLGVEDPSERILNRLIGEEQSGISWELAITELEESDRCHVLALSTAIPTIDSAAERVRTLELLHCLHSNFIRREMERLRGQSDSDAIQLRKKLHQALRHPPIFFLPETDERTTGTNSHQSSETYYET